MDTFEFKNGVRLGLPQALLLLYRYLTGIYTLGDLSFVQFLGGYTCGRRRNLEGARILTVSGNGIGELEKALCLQWKLEHLETMAVHPWQLGIFRLILEASTEEMAEYLGWAEETLHPYPNLQRLFASPGLIAYWQQQCAQWQGNGFGGRVLLFSGSPWKLSPGEGYDAILLSHAQKLLLTGEAKKLCSLLKPEGFLAVLIPAIFHPCGWEGSTPARFSELENVQEAKERMRAKARSLGYEMGDGGSVNIRWDHSASDILHCVSFSIASPLRSLLFGELLIQSLGAELPDHTRLSILDSALEPIRPGAGSGAESLILLLAQKGGA